MNNEIEELKNRMSHLEKYQVDHLGETLHAVKNQKQLIDTFQVFLEAFNRFLDNFTWTVLFLLALIFREKINDIISWMFRIMGSLWSRFSENWQIAIFTIIATALISLGSIYLDRRFRKESYR